MLCIMNVLGPAVEWFRLRWRFVGVSDLYAQGVLLVGELLGEIPRITPE